MMRCPLCVKSTTLVMLVASSCFPPALEQADGVAETQGSPETLEPLADTGDGTDVPRLTLLVSRLDHSSLDILFLVDNSFSMLDEQRALADALPDFFDRLGAFGLPSIHVGVISPDLGGFDGAIPICQGHGDGGALQVTPRIEGCQPPSPEPWIRDTRSGNIRLTNYQGTLAESFACIGQLGTQGCGFEQHLAAIERATSPDHVGNAGFLRSDAKLAVIILADEDDCSASDRRLFEWQDDPELGPPGSFRCSEFGLRCDGRSLEQRPGVFEECVVWTESPYLEEPRLYAQTLLDRKGEGSVFVAAIVAPGSGVEVVPDPMTGGYRIADVCGALNSDAIPGIRFQAFLDHFPGSSRRYSICGADFKDEFAQLGQDLAALGGGPTCLAPYAGEPASCRVFDVVDLGGVGEVRNEIKRCTGANTPCFELKASRDTCPATDHNLLLTVDRPRTPVPGTVLVVECDP